MKPGDSVSLKIPRRKKKLKNVGLSKELAAIGWKQIENATWIRKVGKNHYARILKTCGGKVYLSLRKKGLDNVPLGGSEFPTVVDAVNAFPHTLISWLEDKAAFHETMRKLNKDAAVTLKRSAAAMKRR